MSRPVSRHYPINATGFRDGGTSLPEVYSPISPTCKVPLTTVASLRDQKGLRPNQFHATEVHGSKRLSTSSQQDFCFWNAPQAIAQLTLGVGYLLKGHACYIAPILLRSEYYSAPLDP
jgi:hypothetical protein